jgi:hypothetical protein
VILEGSPNVFIGGGTATTDNISPEVSDRMHKTVQLIGLGSAAVLFGPAVALVGWYASEPIGKAVHNLTGKAFGEGSDLQIAAELGLTGFTAVLAGRTGLKGGAANGVAAAESKWAGAATSRALGGSDGLPYARAVLPGGSGRSIAGHGEYRLGSGNIVVPEGTAITLPREGISITDRTGQFMERGDWEGLAAAAERNARIADDVQGMTTHLPGSSIPNYTLSAPDRLTIYRNSTTVAESTPLSNIIEPNMGCINWAACTVVRR